MTTAYANVNSILARWLKPAVADSAAVDCQGCARKWKCCDFQPFVPGFLLGAMLEAGYELPQGEFHYTALGLVPSATFRKRHSATPADKRQDDLVCGFYDRTQRRCSVWAFRPGECSSYLCTEPVPPERQKLSQSAFDVETGLSQVALAIQGFSEEQIAREIDFLNDPERGIDLPRDPQAIYTQAWEWVSELTADEVRELLEGNE